MLNDSPRYAIVAVTNNAKNLGLELKEKLGIDCPVYTTVKIADSRTVPIEGRVIEGLRKVFQEVDVLICIMAIGAVVRGIAPVIKDKTTDPAVIVMDEKANHVISLLSGHLGGANQVTLKIAELLDSNPVITTATDTQNVVALDNIAKEVNGWREELRHLVKVFNSYLANKDCVYFYQEKSWVSDLRGLTVIKENQIQEVLANKSPFIWLTSQAVEVDEEVVALIHPKPYVLGVGAKKDLPPSTFMESFRAFCEQEEISSSEIAKIASIDVKKNEQAILALAQHLDCPFVTYSNEELQVVADKYPQSEFVKKTVGVGSVALASADLASKGNVLTQRFAQNGATFALGKLGNNY
ncbi:cobalt-precorrin 5A hydrolase [Streptococcus parasanguinis]|uniref:cobalt-precorrin 5A hydrolase n=1 Tax=Streptococcus parasanguinis TaxID=1318 RepID=UPI0034A571FA